MRRLTGAGEEERVRQGLRPPFPCMIVLGFSCQLFAFHCSNFDSLVLESTITSLQLHAQ
jgi:hypothetical protein